MLVAAILAAAAAVLIWAALGFLRPYFRERGARVVTCPENQQYAAVSADAGRAALSGELRLESCSRWPERAGCGQQCLAQLQAAPDGCLVRNILADWYRGKSCAWCGTAIQEIDWAAHRPALLGPGDNRSTAWQDVPAEQVREMLRTHLPVCWRCHISNTFARQHPGWVTDRSPRHRGQTAG
ncbi:MAG: hypothetical protein ACE15B_04630 [Bryobacteraceae bacterium]